MKTNAPSSPWRWPRSCAAMFAGCATTGTNEALEAARIEVERRGDEPRCHRPRARWS